MSAAIPWGLTSSLLSINFVKYLNRSCSIEEGNRESSSLTQQFIPSKWLSCPLAWHVQVRSWNTWVCAVEEGQAERAMLQQAVAHWTTRGARAAFKLWQEQLQAARALEQRAMSIGARLMNTLLVRLVDSREQLLTLKTPCIFHDQTAMWQTDLDR